MFSADQISLLILLGITLTFVGIMLSPWDIVVEEEVSEEELL